MKTYLLFVSSFIFITILNISCKTAITNTENNLNDTHTSQQSLDWIGTYSGILPCADCEGIHTTLIIFDKQNYSLITSYIGKNENNIDTINGQFKWDQNNIILDVNNNVKPSTYKVEENQLRQMDINGNSIDGDLANNYILKKQGNSNVEDKKWKIIEISGKLIDGNRDTHYIIFHSKKNQMEIKAGCNSIIRQYLITNEIKLEIKGGLTTLMACPDETESNLLNALNQVDNISINSDKLSLNKARMAPLVKLELVNE